MHLYYKRYSDSGEPLIILHGLFGNQGNWGLQAKFLAGHYSVFGLDLRNHGRSEWEDPMSYPLMAQDVRKTMRMLGLKKAHVIGHSMGGKTAMQLALDFPALVSKLVVVDIAPVAYEPHHGKIFAGFDDLNLDLIESRLEADEILCEHIHAKAVRDFLLTNLLKDSEGNFSWRMNLDAIRENYDALLAAIESDNSFDGPALFLKGGNSDYILPEHTDTILGLFPGAKVKTIENAGHWLHSEKPDVFLKVVSDFLRE